MGTIDLLGGKIIISEDGEYAIIDIEGRQKEYKIDKNKLRDQRGLREKVRNSRDLSSLFQELEGLDVVNEHKSIPDQDIEVLYKFAKNNRSSRDDVNPSLNEVRKEKNGNVRSVNKESNIGLSQCCVYDVNSEGSSIVFKDHIQSLNCFPKLNLRTYDQRYNVADEYNIKHYPSNLRRNRGSYNLFNNEQRGTQRLENEIDYTVSELKIEQEISEATNTQSDVLSMNTISVARGKFNDTSTPTGNKEAETDDKNITKIFNDLPTINKDEVLNTDLKDNEQSQPIVRVNEINISDYSDCYQNNSYDKDVEITEDTSRKETLDVGVSADQFIHLNPHYQNLSFLRSKSLDCLTKVGKNHKMYNFEKSELMESLSRLQKSQSMSEIRKRKPKLVLSAKTSNDSPKIKETNLDELMKTLATNNLSISDYSLSSTLKNNPIDEPDVCCNDVLIQETDIDFVSCNHFSLGSVDKIKPEYRDIFADAALSSAFEKGIEKYLISYSSENNLAFSEDIFKINKKSEVDISGDEPVTCYTNVLIIDEKNGTSYPKTGNLSKQKENQINK